MKKHNKRKAKEPEMKEGTFNTPKKPYKMMAGNKNVTTLALVGTLLILVVSILYIAQLTENVGMLSQKLNEEITNNAATQPVVTAVGQTDLCTVACNINRADITIPIEATNEDLCPSDVLNILAFHSPTCSYCTQQEPSLEMLEAEYGSNINIEYACLAIHEGDDALCAAEPEKWDYQADEAAILAQKYAAGATPTLIFDCGLKRVGSTAVRDGAQKEFEDLKKAVDAMMS